MKSRLDDLDSALSRVEAWLPNYIVLTPNAEGFEVLNPGVGQIAVSFLSIKPSASGSEVTIDAVNLSATTMINVQFSGHAFSSENREDLKDGQAIQPVYKGKSGFTLPSGKQVKISIKVPLITPDKFKEMGIGASVGGINYKVGK